MWCHARAAVAWHVTLFVAPAWLLEHIAERVLNEPRTLTPRALAHAVALDQREQEQVAVRLDPQNHLAIALALPSASLVASVRAARMLGVEAAILRSHTPRRRGIAEPGIAKHRFRPDASVSTAPIEARR
jgi:predicted deacetylase